MKDEIITLETGRLAKEKGFNTIQYDGMGGYYSNCTQSLLQRWLREIHNIDLWVQPFVVEHDKSVRNKLISYIPDESYSYFIFKDGSWVKDAVDLLDYEEALEIGLVESLKLIK